MATVLEPAASRPRLSRPWRLLLNVVGLLAVLAFAYYVYPTRYAMYGDYRSGLVRVDRFSGKADLLTEHGWERLEPDALDAVFGPTKRP